MSIAEIEHAVDQLDDAEKRRVLEHIQATLSKPVPIDLADRRNWLERLRAFRQSNSTGKHVMSGDQIISEMREE